MTKYQAKMLEGEAQARAMNEAARNRQEAFDVATPEPRTIPRYQAISRAWWERDLEKSLWRTS